MIDFYVVLRPIEVNFTHNIVFIMAGFSKYNRKEGDFKNNLNRSKYDKTYSCSLCDYDICNFKESINLEPSYIYTKVRSDKCCYC